MNKRTFSFAIPWPSLSINWRSWLPSRGNILFTLLVLVGLIWAQSAGALPLRSTLLHVVKARDGDPNVAFAWRLSAHRKGYAGVRLEEAR